MYKQLIIARKDLNMSPGKLAAQVSHASMAFITSIIRKSAQWKERPHGLQVYHIDFDMSEGLYENWVNGSFTKIICEARNKNNLMRAIEIAKEIGMEEGEEFFLIRDNCLTELTPEDEDGRTLTCIGFCPMNSEVIEKISKKYQLYK